jgi:hypothetical protein
MKTQAKVAREVLLLPSLSLGINRPPHATWPVFTSWLPREPENCVVIYNTAGLVGASFQRSGVAIEWAGVQIRTRARSSDDAERMICDIVEALDQVYRGGEVTVTDPPNPPEDYLTSSLSRVTAIIDLGEEPERKLRSFVVNYAISFERVA